MVFLLLSLGAWAASGPSTAIPHPPADPLWIERLVAFQSAAVAAMAAERYELSDGVRPQQMEGGTCAVQPITFNVTVSATIDTGSCFTGAPTDVYVDFYGFTGAAGTSIRATYTGASSLNPLYLTIQRQSDGAVLASMPGSGQAILSYTLPATDNYLIGVSTLTSFATGTYTILLSNGGCSAAYGDLNQDGRVDASDLVILSGYLVGNFQAGTAPFTAALTFADLNQDGKVDVVDLVVLENYLVGNITCLPQ